MKICIGPSEDDLINHLDLTPHEFLSLFTFVNIDFDPKTIDSDVDFDSLPPEEMFKYCKHLKLGKRHFQKAVSKGLLDGLTREEIFLKSVSGSSLFHVKDTFQNGAGIDLSGYLNEGLLIASTYGHFDIAKYLINRGANVNYQDDTWGWTPLLKAAFYGHLDLIQLLIERGADIKAKCNIGSILLLSIHHIEIVDYLLSLGIDPDCALRSATYFEFSDVVELLIENGANVNAVNSSY